MRALPFFLVTTLLTFASADPILRNTGIFGFICATKEHCVCYRNGNVAHEKPLVPSGWSLKMPFITDCYGIQTSWAIEKYTNVDCVPANSTVAMTATFTIQMSIKDPDDTFMELMKTHGKYAEDNLVELPFRHEIFNWCKVRTPEEIYSSTKITEEMETFLNTRDLTSEYFIIHDITKGLWKMPDVIESRLGMDAKRLLEAEQIKLDKAKQVRIMQAREHELDIERLNADHAAQLAINATRSNATIARIKAESDANNTIIQANATAAASKELADAEKDRHTVAFVKLEMARIIHDPKASTQFYASNANNYNFDVSSTNKQG